MCGLTGFLDGDVRSSDGLRTRNQAMTDSLRLRVPDGEGIWLGEDIEFGYRTLNIPDYRPADAQPMSFVCERITKTFNGNIYNDLDQRQELDVSTLDHISAADLVKALVVTS